MLIEHKLTLNDL